ncbi:MAG: toll/interleukin-1 receptor domain-containing protein, partial [Acidobacteria bacterium]|nr:toll/interleukin-1 receptor domain-containing protein [Acidobacteriota bacterium]
MSRVFLSYSTKNADVAQKITQDLRDRGIDIYYADLDMALGAAILEELHAKIAQSDCFLLLLSEHSVRSNWVEREVSFALTQQSAQRLQIVPVMVSQCELPGSISHIKYIDLVAGYEQGLDAIVKSILTVTVTPYSNIGVILARKGGSGRRGQRAAYGVAGFPGRLLFHWVIDSVGCAAYAIQCTGAAHDLITIVLKEILGNETVRKVLVSENPKGLEGIVTQLFEVMNVAVLEVRLEAATNGKRVGSKAVIALQRPGEVLCATLGTCGGLASWMTPEGTTYQRIESPSYFVNRLIQMEELSIKGVAPLGYLEGGAVKVAWKHFPQQEPGDFVALT